MTTSDSIPFGQAVPAMRPVSLLEGADLEAVIGRLVRDALQHQLALPTAAARPVAPAVTRPAVKPTAKPAAIAGQRITDAVVSLRALESLPEGASRVEIGARAVLTPAAADLLRQRRVEVVRGDRSGKQPKPEGVPAVESCCWIADADHPERTSGYVRQLAGRGLSAASVELPQKSAPNFPGATGVVVAELPAIHVDHFARQLSISAAAVGSLSEVSRIAAAMSPAVWVLDAERLSFSGRVAVAAECIRIAQAQAAEKRRPR